MMKRREDLVKSFVCLASALLIFAYVLPVCFAVDIDQAGDGISRAEQTLGLAYNAVAGAAASGADVSDMLQKLDVAGSLLSEAHADFRGGDYDNALGKAVSCENALIGLVDQATSLRTEALRSSNERFIVSGISSVVGLILVLVFGFLGWRSLKRWHFRRVLDMKPGVEETQ